MTRPGGIRSTTSSTKSAYAGGSSPWARAADLGPTSRPSGSQYDFSVRRQAGVDVLDPGKHAAVDVGHVRMARRPEESQALRRPHTRPAVQDDSLVEGQLFPCVTVVER